MRRDLAPDRKHIPGGAWKTRRAPERQQRDRDALARREVVER
jgi:hypothetical protein